MVFARVAVWFVLCLVAVSLAFGQDEEAPPADPQTQAPETTAPVESDEARKSKAERSKAGDDAVYQAEWKEYVAGDPERAIALYEAITRGTGNSATLRARATLGIARCQRKLGELQKSRVTLEQLLVDFPGEAAILSEARGYLRELQEGRSDNEAFDWFGDLERNPQIQARIFDLAMQLVSPTSDAGQLAGKQLLALGSLAVKPLDVILSTSRNDIQRFYIALILVQLGKKSAWQSCMELVRELLSDPWGSESQRAHWARFMSVVNNYVRDDPELLQMTRSENEADRARRAGGAVEAKRLPALLRVLASDVELTSQELAIALNDADDELRERIAADPAYVDQIQAFVAEAQGWISWGLSALLEKHPERVTKSLLAQMEQAASPERGMSLSLEPSLLHDNREKFGDMSEFPKTRRSLASNLGDRLRNGGTEQSAKVDRMIVELLLQFHEEGLVLRWAMERSGLVPWIKTILESPDMEPKEAWKNYWQHCERTSEAHRAALIEVLQPFVDSENPVVAHFSLCALAQIKEYSEEKWLEAVERFLKRDDFPSNGPRPRRDSRGRDRREDSPYVPTVADLTSPSRGSGNRFGENRQAMLRRVLYSPTTTAQVRRQTLNVGNLGNSTQEILRILEAEPESTLIPLLFDPTSLGVASWAQSALGKSNQDEWFASIELRRRVINALVEHPETHVRRSATRLLANGILATDEQVPLWRLLVKDSETSEDAVTTILSYASNEARVLGVLLEMENPSYRLSAATALAQLTRPTKNGVLPASGPDSVAILKTLISDPDTRVRETATLSLKTWELNEQRARNEPKPPDPPKE